MVEVATAATVTVTAGDVLDVKLVSPEYTAVIELAPTVSELVSSVATPPLKVPVPSEVVPSKNSAVPVGVPVAGLIGATVAVNVTDWPDTGALGKKVTVVVEVAAAATVTVTAGEVLDAKLVSPE